MTPRTASFVSLRDELEGTTARLHALVDAMDDTAWSKRPGAGRWSVAECVEHLNITSRAYVPLLREAIRDGRERGLTTSSASNRLDFMGWMLLKSLEPPVKRVRMKTSTPFVPASIEPKPGVVSEYEALQRALIAILAEADGLALSKIKVTSAFNAKLRYSVYSAYRVISAHQRRHLWQAEQAREAVRAVAR